MGISTHPWDLHQEGSRDASRHKEKLKEAFRKKLTDIISQEDIITSERGKKVKVPIKALDSYRFIFDHKKQKHVAEGDGHTKEGDIVGREEQDDEDGEFPKPGQDAGEEYYEAEIELADLIEMMLEDLNLPRLEPKKKADLTAPQIRYDHISRRGPMSALDKKKTLIENLKRNARHGNPKVGHLNQDDLRFRSWNEYHKPITSAVVLAMMDISGSMGPKKRYLARSFFFWLVNFLRQKYQDVEIVFIAHTTEAFIVNEHDFFYRGESGGTVVSTAYELALQQIETKYSPDAWNIYAFHFSDGETFGDEAKCSELLKKISAVSNVCGYGEISLQKTMWDGWSTLFSNYKKDMINVPNFVQSKIMKKEDIWPTLKRFLAEEIDTGEDDLEESGENGE